MGRGPPRRERFVNIRRLCTLFGGLGCDPDTSTGSLFLPCPRWPRRTHTVRGCIFVSRDPFSHPKGLFPCFPHVPFSPSAWSALFQGIISSWWARQRHRAPSRSLWGPILGRPSRPAFSCPGLRPRDSASQTEVTVRAPSSRLTEDCGVCLSIKTSQNSELAFRGHLMPLFGGAVPPLPSLS